MIRWFINRYKRFDPTEAFHPNPWRAFWYWHKDLIPVVLMMWILLGITVYFFGGSK
jgi:hypothetical protein